MDPLEVLMEKAEQETEYGRSQISQFVSGVSRPSLPSARITLSVQDSELADREEDCSCMQHAIIPFCAMAEGES